MLANMACNRIKDAVLRRWLGAALVVAELDPYNPTGSTIHSDWEAEFCRVVEGHPQVRAYVKNHNLGFEVPYLYGSDPRKYRPDFIVLVDDGRGPDDLLHLIVEIKGYRGEDAKDKKATMETYWIPGVNNLKTYGRWAFAEFTEVYQIQSAFNEMIEKFGGG